MVESLHLNRKIKNSLDLKIAGKQNKIKNNFKNSLTIIKII
jgi:hypothetical protein